MTIIPCFCILPVDDGLKNTKTLRLQSLKCRKSISYILQLTVWLLILTLGSILALTVAMLSRWSLSSACPFFSRLITFSAMAKMDGHLGKQPLFSKSRYMARSYTCSPGKKTANWLNSFCSTPVLCYLTSLNNLRTKTTSKQYWNRFSMFSNSGGKTTLQAFSKRLFKFWQVKFLANHIARIGGLNQN